MVTTFMSTDDLLNAYGEYPGQATAQYFELTQAWEIALPNGRNLRFDANPDRNADAAQVSRVVHAYNYFTSLLLQIAQIEKRNALLERVLHVADKFTDCVSEFGNDAPSACSECYAPLEDLVIKAKDPETSAMLYELDGANKTLLAIYHETTNERIRDLAEAQLVVAGILESRAEDKA